MWHTVYKCVIGIFIYLYIHITVYKHICELYHHKYTCFVGLFIYSMQAKYSCNSVYLYITCILSDTNQTRHIFFYMYLYITVYEHVRELYNQKTTFLVGLFMGDKGNMWRIEEVLNRKKGFAHEFERHCGLRQQLYIKVSSYTMCFHLEIHVPNSGNK